MNDHQAILEPDRTTAPSDNKFVRALSVLSENTYLSSIRSAMVSVVPLTIIGGLFMIIAYLPLKGWEARVAPYHAASAEYL